MTTKKPPKQASSGEYSFEIVPLADLLLDDQNANLGTVRGLAMLDDSLSEDGAGRSVLLDKNKKSIAGNKTIERAIDRGFEQAIIVHSKGKAIVAHMRDDIDLNTPQGRRMAIRDNRVSEIDLQWSPEMLQELEPLLDRAKFFDDDEWFDIITPLVELGDRVVGAADDEKTGSQPSDFWPEIRVRVNPDVKKRFDEIWTTLDGDDSERMMQMIAAVSP